MGLASARSCVCAPALLMHTPEEAAVTADPSTDEGKPGDKGRDGSDQSWSSIGVKGDGSA
jgi:hypothetical protein